MFSNSVEYAIRGLSELATRNDSRVMLDELVTGTNLPREFMAKIFQKLVRAGILRSSKGRGGGFQLARASHDITLMNIVEAMDGPQVYDRCVVGLEKCHDTMSCPQHDLYKPIRQRLKDYLNTTTLADLASSLRAKQAWNKVRSTEGLPVDLMSPTARDGSTVSSAASSISGATSSASGDSGKPVIRSK